LAETIDDKIRDLAMSVLEDTDLFLVDFILKGHKGSRTLWIYVDSEKGGVNLDECAKVSEELGFLLEAHDVIAGRYRLNVSSPGVDKPLVDKRQYYIKIGRNASVTYQIDDEQKKIVGVIKEFDGDKLLVEQKNGQKEIISFDDIVETKILTAW